MLQRRTACLLLLTLALGSPLLAAPPVPSNCRAIPDYGNGSIIVQWDDVMGETGYRVYRSETAGGPYTQVGGDVAAGTTQTTDPGRDDTKEYFYVVRSFDGSGESGNSNEFQQNIKVLWPVPTSHEIMHTWNDTIGAAGVVNGYHQGCDLQRINADDMVIIPRGGKVTTTGSGGADDNFIYTRVKIGATNEYDSFNHVEGANAAALLVAKDQYVRAGQQVGNMGKTHFPVNFTDHTHFYVTNADFGTGTKHPFLMFSANADLDPMQNPPALTDHANPPDGTELYHVQGQPAATYLAYDGATMPLGDDSTTAAIDEGNIDIHVEIGDQQGTLPDQDPQIVSYWIEGPRPPVGGTDYDNVRSAADPYVLIDWDNTYFGAAPAPNWRHIMDQSQNLGPTIMEGGETYPWENYKHFIITNTMHDDGAPGHIDQTQYWNTNARNDAAISPTAGEANFAGKPDTIIPSEARFPDGNYTIHVLASDLVHSDEALDIHDVRLENFTPFIKRLTVYQDLDNNLGTMVDIDHPGCEAELYNYRHDNPNPYPGGNYLAIAQRPVFARAERRICVKVRFSESVDTTAGQFKVELDPQGAAGAAALEVGGGMFSKTYDDNDTWTGQITVALDPSGNSDAQQASPNDDAVIRVTARDLRDRNNNHRGLDQNADGTPEGMDENHKIKLDASTPIGLIRIQ
jgi:murein DD-endopeptidase MepM/ murein hydrolase activator NlpD